MTTARILWIAILATVGLLSSFSQAEQTAIANPLVQSKKMLIVYLSRTNKTKAIAEMIHRAMGGTMVALELEKPYPADYHATVKQVVRENETGYLPP